MESQHRKITKNHLLFASIVVLSILIFSVSRHLEERNKTLDAKNQPTKVALPTKDPYPLARDHKPWNAKPKAYPEPAVTPTRRAIFPPPSPEPTNPPLPTQTPYLTPTPIPAAQIEGQWSQLTLSDGLCTNTPQLFRYGFYGTGSRLFCQVGSTSKWIIPVGSKVNTILPGVSGLFVGSNAGLCVWTNWTSPNMEYIWECPPGGDKTLAGEEINEILSLKKHFVYRLNDAILYGGTRYPIVEIVGNRDSYLTTFAISERYRQRNSIWVGTNDSGVISIDAESGEIQRYTESDGLPGDNIRKLVAVSCPDYCSFQDVWVATDHGVGHWDGHEWIAYTIADGLPSNDVRGVATRQRNTVWAATDKGAAYYDGNTWRAFNLESGLPVEDLYGVAYLDWKTLGFSTHGEGLLVFELAFGESESNY